MRSRVLRRVERLKIKNLLPPGENKGRSLSMKRVQPAICRHFGECGGCRFQDLEYPMQLRMKDERCRSLLRDCGISTDLQPIIPSPRVFHYRNKMELTFDRDGGKPICGLHRRDRAQRIFQLDECRIGPEDAPLITAAVTEFARGSGLPAYHPYRREGFWRNLVIREGKFTGQILINVVTTSRGEIDEAKLGQAIEGLPSGKRIASLIRTVNDSPSNAVVPQRLSLIRGEPFLEENIGGLTFRIPPFSFFQVNPFILETFYGVLKDLLALTGDEHILDVFCGSGTIGLVLSSRAAAVTGIEVDEQAVETARINAGLNRRGNLSFLAGKAADVLLRHRDRWRRRFHVAVVNPPRPGISKKVAKRILEIEPERIVYSSCNPESFLTQAALLLNNYHLEIIQPFDFFPHTPHMEMLAVFRRKSN
ncbi:MAG: 23S rRNA (uracil(1939)-C(5))-methyltransferase RlmD [PVC group bacterium]